MEQIDSNEIVLRDEQIEGETNTQLMRRLGLYFLGNISAKLVSMLLTRLQTYFLTPMSFGDVTMVLNAIPLLISFCFMEIWSGVLKFMFEREDEEGKRQIITNGFAIALMMVPLFLVVGTMLGLYGGTQYIPYILIYGFLYLLDYIYQFGARGLGFNKLFAITGIVSTAVIGVVQILCLAVFDLGDLSLLISPAVAALVSVLIYESKTKQLRKARFSQVDWKIMKRMTRFAIPLAFNAIAFFALTVVNQFIISAMAGSGEVGLYNAAGRISSIVNLLVTVFSLAWQETAFSLNKMEGRAGYYSITLERYVTIIGMAVLVGIPFSYIIFPWFIDASFQSSWTLLPASLLFAAMAALTNYMGHIFSSENLTKHLTISTAVAAAVNILTVVLLLPLIGLQAGYIALTLGFTVNFVYRMIYIQKYLKITFAWKRALLYVALIAAAVWLYFNLPNRSSYWVFLGVTIVVALIILWRDIKPIFAKLKALIGSMRGKK